MTQLFAHPISSRKTMIIPYCPPRSLCPGYAAIAIFVNQIVPAGERSQLLPKQPQPAQGETSPTLPEAPFLRFPMLLVEALSSQKDHSRDWLQYQLAFLARRLRGSVLARCGARRHWHSAACTCMDGQFCTILYDQKLDDCNARAPSWQSGPFSL